MSAGGLFVDRSGSGEPLVLLHGIGGRGGMWDPVRSGLAAGHDTIVPDLPGFGRSPLGGVTPTVSGFADRIEELCAELGVARPHVAGSSMGGAVALELGRRGAARSVVAFAPIGFWRAPGERWCRAVLTAMRALTPKLRPALPMITATPAGRAAGFFPFYGLPGRVPAEVLVADADAFLGAEAFEQTLAGFAGHRFGRSGGLADIPVTVAWGSRDRVLPCRTQARAARRALPGAEHVVLPGCGHLPIHDDPDACLMLLRRQWRDRAQTTLIDAGRA